MLADYHVHTDFSDDSIYPMEQVIKDAIAMGMDEICFTDHVDYGIKQDWDCTIPMEYRGSEPLANVNYPRYVSEIRRLQSLYGTEITIKLGLVFGIQVHTIIFAHTAKWSPLSIYYNGFPCEPQIQKSNQLIIYTGCFSSFFITSFR